MRQKRLGAAAAALFCAALSAALLTSCGGKKVLQDGVYTAQSSVFEGLEDEEFADMGAAGDGYGVVTITVKDHQISACEFQTFTTDGTLKDENYGKRDGAIRNQDYYNKAQRAVKGSEQYAEILVRTGDLKKVDAISGATISWNEFQEAAEAALKEASK